VVTVGVFEYRETSIGPYNEVGVAIFVYPKRYGHRRSLAGRRSCSTGLIFATRARMSSTCGCHA
jgi:hypothetical protein